MEELAAIPLLVSLDMQEKIAASDSYADAFFTSEHVKVRNFYRKTGNPRISLIMGESVTKFGASLPVYGSAGLAALHLFMAEMRLALGSAKTDVTLAVDHLVEAREQAEASTGRDASLSARILIQWHWLMSICAKAGGGDCEYRSLLNEGLKDTWIRKQVNAPDYVAIVRQQVMMSQDLDRHLILLNESAAYRSERPLEYYRTIKRVMEFLTNSGLIDSAERLRPEFVRSFAVVRPKSTLVAKISFLKNLAHLMALQGEVVPAVKLLDLSTKSATTAGLEGQIRQLHRLKIAVQESDVRGALITFRV